MGPVVGHRLIVFGGLGIAGHQLTALDGVELPFDSSLARASLSDGWRLASILAATDSAGCLRSAARFLSDGPGPRRPTRLRDDAPFAYTPPRAPIWPTTQRPVPTPAATSTATCSDPVISARARQMSRPRRSPRVCTSATRCRRYLPPRVESEGGPLPCRQATRIGKFGLPNFKAGTEAAAALLRVSCH